MGLWTADRSFASELLFRKDVEIEEIMYNGIAWLLKKRRRC